jgi:hypothetical protein
MGLAQLSSPGLFKFFRVYYNASGHRQQLFLSIPKYKIAMSEEDKRFVIQEHTTSSDVHWDFMLEWEPGEALQTYRLDKTPQQILRSPVGAVRIFDHSPKFLTYQGPVNKGRGNVRIIESGTYRLVQNERDHIELNLAGQILKGKFTLRHIEDDRWQFSAANANG